MKKLENAKKLIIHDGTFHADDVMCAAIMRKLNPDIIIERVSEVPEYVESDTVIADIGGGEFDHHQKNARKRKNGEEYCACGLLLEKCWKKLFPKAQDYKKFVGDYIIPIERQDNGMRKNPLSTYITALNPVWGNDEDEDKCFEKAIGVLYDLLSREIMRAESIRNAKGQVKQALKKSNGDTVVLKEWMPYDRILGHSAARFVIYPDSRGRFKLRCLYGSGNKPKCRLPEEWLASPPAGCTFVHTKCFLAAFGTLEEALDAAGSIPKENKKQENIPDSEIAAVPRNSRNQMNGTGH